MRALPTSLVFLMVLMLTVVFLVGQRRFGDITVASAATFIRFFSSNVNILQRKGINTFSKSK